VCILKLIYEKHVASSILWRSLFTLAMSTQRNRHVRVSRDYLSLVSRKSRKGTASSSLAVFPTRRRYQQRASGVTEDARSSFVPLVSDAASTVPLSAHTSVALRFRAR